MHPRYCRCLLAFPAFLASMAPAHAQIITDGTLGPAGSLSGPNYQIPASLGQKFGPNLFHSFKEFQLANGESANFTGPASIQNILSRVTGGNPSIIDGQLNSNIAGANFFFINPSGTIFGPNAQVNVSGGFVVTTADVLHLADGGRFDALTPSATVLSSAPPAAFGLLSPQPAPIILVGTQITAAPAQNITLIGGDIDLQGGAVLKSVDGSINLFSVGSAGLLDSTDLSNFSKLGTISINSGSVLLTRGAGGSTIRAGRLLADGPGTYISVENDTSGPTGTLDIETRGNLEITNSARIQSVSSAAGPGPDVTVKANRLITASDGALVTEADSTGRGGNLSVQAKEVILDGTNSVEDFSGLGALSLGDGDGGNVTLKTDKLSIIGGADVTTENLGGGRGGAIAIEAGDILIRGSGSNILAQSHAAQGGDGGSIAIRAKSLHIKNGGSISTTSQGAGNAGDIVVEADSVRLEGDGSGDAAISASTQAAIGGRGGNVILHSKDLQMTGGALVTADTGGTGAGGSIQVTADTIDVQGFGALSGFFARTAGSGHGGNISLRAKNLRFLGDAGASTAVYDRGAGGNITVDAGSVLLDGANQSLGNGFFAETQGPGASGSVVLHAGRLKLDGGANISTATVGPGKGGLIDLTADSVILDGPPGGGILAVSNGSGDGDRILMHVKSLQVLNAASILANTAGTGKAGGIEIYAKDILLDAKGNDEINGIGSESRTATSGDGGSIYIQTDNLTLKDGASISTTTAGSGQGGPLTIVAGNVALSGHNGHKASILAATIGVGKDAGNAGELTLSAKNLALTGDAVVSASTVGDGNGGRVIINADNLVVDGAGSTNSANISSDTVQPGAIGIGGDLSITAKNLRVVNGGTISTATASTGQGGTLKVKADRIEISGGSFITALTVGEGTGGDVNVTSGSISIDGGGTLAGISADSFDGPGFAGKVNIETGALDMRNSGYISSSSTGSGNGGSVSVHAGSLSMDDSLLTALATHGNAGSINLSVDGASGIHGDSRITTTASEQNGGDINIAVGKRLTIDSHSAISAEARGNGGNISVKLGDGLYLRDAAISALSGNNGGNITVDGLNLRSPRYIVLNNGRVIASATFQKGGDILLRSKVFVPSANSIIDASSRFGVAGNIAIEAPNTNVGASLVTLPSNLLTAENYLPERCIVRQTGQSSSLTVTTEPGVPPQPGDPLPSHP